MTSAVSVRLPPSSVPRFFQICEFIKPMIIGSHPTTYHKLIILANSMLTYDLVSHDFEIDSISQDEHNDKSQIPFDTAKQKVKELVTESVLTRSIADVPLGTFLSGGVDSSIVSLCLAQQTVKPIDTFSIGFEKKSYDETDKSRIVGGRIDVDRGCHTENSSTCVRRVLKAT